jgi:hypothetical protein
MVGSEDRMILDCYHLARYYHVSPEVFLNMTLGEVRLHLQRTIQLEDKIAYESKNLSEPD